MSAGTATELEGVTIRGETPPGAERILTPEALELVAELHRRFDARRRALLETRHARQADFDADGEPGFLAETADVRTAEWTVAACPADLRDRRVEITGPVDRKMMINALNSGASCFMADFEDSLSPTWANVVAGQANLHDAVRRTLRLETEKKTYELNDRLATLLVRPRGWHLVEKHVCVDGEPVSASLFDFGLFLFHDGRELLRRGSGPYLYLPKLESHLEARLWNDVFVAAQERLGIPHGSIRATVLIETITAAFEMDEILYELRDHAAGLNAGRWDYIFSIIKKFRERGDFVLPDRAQVGMTVPFMNAYCELLVRTCHRRGAHAMGGMAAFIPNRRRPDVTERALAKVREDKERETRMGFDGTWVAHPDLVPVAREVFDRVLGDRPNQTEVVPDVHVTADRLLRTGIVGGAVTEEGVRTNVSVALRYLEAWLGGDGAAAIDDLMEDAATAEISRAQLWQWIRHRVRIADDGAVTPDLFCRVRDDVLAELRAERNDTRRLERAATLLDELVLADDFEPFLTVPAYRHLA